MIDFHSHILPQVDDGSQSVEETFALLKEAESVGFTDIIFTPHYMEGYYEKSTEEIKLISDAVVKIAKKENNKLNLYTGNELYFSKNIVRLLNEKKASSINNSKYVLFEFSINEKPMDIMEYIYLLQENNYVPVLAHPERYSFVQRNPDIVYELVNVGVLMQSNYGSIMGVYGKKAQIIAEKLLECNMVYFLGSDVHRKNTIYTMVPEALKKIEKIIGKDMLRKLTDTNPRKVLENDSIEYIEPENIKFSFTDKIKLGI